MNLGPAEILVILVLALLVFGPKRLPEVGRQVGGAMRELRRMQDSVKAELSTALAEDPPRAPASAAPKAAPEIAPEVVEEPDHADLPPADLPRADLPPADGFDGAPETFS